MRAAAVASVLAVATLGLVVFIFVDLHAANHPPAASLPEPTAAPPGAPPPTTLPVAAATPVATGPVRAAPPPSIPLPPPAAPPPPSNGEEQAPPDPLERRVDGRTIRQWRAYYFARQRATQSEINRHQAIVDRALRGEEPDERELGEAHTRIGELNERIRQDEQELQRIENTP